MSCVTGRSHLRMPPAILPQRHLAATGSRTAPREDARHLAHHKRGHGGDTYHATLRTAQATRGKLIAVAYHYSNARSNARAARWTGVEVAAVARMRTRAQRGAAAKHRVRICALDCLRHLRAALRCVTVLGMMRGMQVAGRRIASLRPRTHRCAAVYTHIADLIVFFAGAQNRNAAGLCDALACCVPSRCARPHPRTASDNLQRHSCDNAVAVERITSRTTPSFDNRVPQDGAGERGQAMNTYCDSCIAPQYTRRRHHRIDVVAKWRTCAWTRTYTISTSLLFSRHHSSKR